MIKGHGGNIYDLARRLSCSPADIVDLSSNVNPLGPPSGLCDYLCRHVDAIASLPEVDNHGIIRDYAGTLGVSPDRLIAGNGTTQFIHTLPAVLKMKKALIVGPTYSDYADACRFYGVPFDFHLCREEQDFQPDIDSLQENLAGVDAVFICNPNNPTGALVPAERLKPLCLSNPNVRFIVDESYLPFVTRGEKESLAGGGMENLLVLLSISKIYRIPGLRVGFLVASPAVIAAFAEFIWPWSVNSLGQAAVRFLAQAGPALDGFVADTRRHLSRQRQELAERLQSIPGLKLYPGTASFMLIRLPEGLSAPEVWSRLAEEGILIRDCSNFQGLSNRFIRVCPKTSETGRRLAERIAELATARVASGLYGQNPTPNPKHETRNKPNCSKRQ